MTYLNTVFFNPLEAFEEDDEIFELSLLPFGDFLNADLLFLGFFLFIATLLTNDTPEEEDEEEGLLHKHNYYFLFFLSITSASILLQNFFGLIPSSSALTTDLIANLVMSLIILLTLWLELLYRHKSNFFGHFLPNGAPTVIAPFIILIEIVSSLSRVVSLSVRIFANLSAGHSLVEIILKFSLAFLVLKLPLTFFFFVPIFIVIIIIALEFAVAYLQAYVFGTLLAIYLDELS